MIYKSEIELWKYDLFLQCDYYIEQFKKSKLSTLKKDYDRQVKMLKERADNIALFSRQDIDLIIPQRPHEILSYLFFSLQHCTDLEIINYFLNFFNYSTKNITKNNYINLICSTDKEKNPFYITYKAHNLRLYE